MTIKTLTPIGTKKKSKLIQLIQVYFSLLALITRLQCAFSSQTTREIHIEWFSTNFSALDIGVGPKADVFVIGIDKNLYFYEFRANQFILVEKDLKLKEKNFMRLDVDESGIPFVVTEDFEIYFYSDKGKWVHLPGCARDIGIGKNQNLWKIGCNEDLDGYGIWNLFCFSSQNDYMKKEAENEHLNESIKINTYNNGSIKSVPSLIYQKLEQERKMKTSNHYRRNNYRVNHKESTQLNFGIYNQNDLEGNMHEYYSNCFWLKGDAAGMRIDVGENGNPIIADKGGNLKIYDLSLKKTFVYEGVKVRDVTVSNDGIIFVTDFNDFSIYKLSFLKRPKSEDNNNKKTNEGEFYVSNFNADNQDEIDYENYKWTKISGKAVAISAGPYSQPFIVNREGLVLTSAKFGFN